MPGASVFRYVIEKGSVAVDGVSLTVSAASEPDPGGGQGAGPPWFEVSLIPETLARTTLGRKQPGDTGQPGGRHDRQVRGEARHDGSPVMTRLTRGRGRGRTAGRRRAGDAATSRPAARWSCSTTPTARTRATSSSPPARATPELLAFTIRHTSGVICVPMPGADLDRLAAAADDRAELRAHADRVHGQRGRRGRGHHRHLRGRPDQHGPGPGSTRRPSPATWSGPGTSSRCATPRAACCAGPGTPRPPSTWPGWPGCRRRACWPRSSTTTAPWPGCRTCARSPTSTGWRSSRSSS